MSDGKPIGLDRDECCVAKPIVRLTRACRAKAVVPCRADAQVLLATATTNDFGIRAIALATDEASARDGAQERNATNAIARGRPSRRRAMATPGWCVSRLSALAHDGIWLRCAGVRGQHL